MDTYAKNLSDANIFRGIYTGVASALTSHKVTGTATTGLTSKGQSTIGNVLAIMPFSDDSNFLATLSVDSHIHHTSSDASGTTGVEFPTKSGIDVGLGYCFSKKFIVDAGVGMQLMNTSTTNLVTGGSGDSQRLPALDVFIQGISKMGDKTLTSYKYETFISKKKTFSTAPGSLGAKGSSHRLHVSTKFN